MNNLKDSQVTKLRVRQSSPNVGSQSAQATSKSMFMDMNKRRSMGNVHAPASSTLPKSTKESRSVAHLKDMFSPTHLDNPSDMHLSTLPASLQSTHERTSQWRKDLSQHQGDHLVESEDTHSFNTTSTDRRKSVRELFNQYGLDTPTGLLSSEHPPDESLEMMNNPHQHHKFCHNCSWVNTYAVKQCLKCGHALCSECAMVSSLDVGDDSKMKTPKKHGSTRSAVSRVKESEKSETTFHGKKLGDKPAVPHLPRWSTRRLSKKHNVKDRKHTTKLSSVDVLPDHTEPLIRVQTELPQTGNLSEPGTVHSTFDKELPATEHVAESRSNVAPYDRNTETRHEKSSGHDNTTMSRPEKESNMPIPVAQHDDHPNAPSATVQHTPSHGSRHGPNQEMYSHQHSSRRDVVKNQYTTYTTHEMTTSHEDYPCSDPGCRATHNGHSPYRHSIACKRNVLGQRSYFPLHETYSSDHSSEHGENNVPRHAYPTHIQWTHDHQSPNETFSSNFVDTPVPGYEYIECHGYPRTGHDLSRHGSMAEGALVGQCQHCLTDCQCEACQNSLHNVRCCVHESHANQALVHWHPVSHHNNSPTEARFSSPGPGRKLSGVVPVHKQSSAQDRRLPGETAAQTILRTRRKGATRKKSPLPSKEPMDTFSVASTRDESSRGYSVPQTPLLVTRRQSIEVVAPTPRKVSHEPP